MSAREPSALGPAGVDLARRTATGADLAAIAREMAHQAERAMTRASDAPSVDGNAARLLVDGPAAFEAWLRAIAAAEKWVHLENYILRDDRTGRRFRDALVERARAGVRVRVLYDWVGCWATPRSYWRPFREAGVDVRAFAPPSLQHPLTFARRDHRKVVAVDGQYASVAGMCIGDEWAGDPASGIPPWRDTGVELTGPVAAVVDQAFASAWAAAGPPLPDDEFANPSAVEPVGDVAVRVVQGEPGRSRVYRLQQFVAVGVERSLWITDPYFVAPPAMVEALGAAARDGVDVRVLVPAYNNWPIVGGMSRAGYRPLLEAGVRLYEWEGPMIHAKTAVADGLWSRIGSSNLNLASLLGNWEMDVAIVDRAFAEQVESLFLQDLDSSVEIHLRRTAFAGGSGYSGPDRRRLQRVPAAVEHTDAQTAVETLASARDARRRAPRHNTSGRLLGRLSRAASVLGRALVGQRTIGQDDRGWVAAIGMIATGIGAVAAFAPRAVAWPLAALLLAFGAATLLNAWRGPRRGE